MCARSVEYSSYQKRDVKGSDGVFQRSIAHFFNILPISLLLELESEIVISLHIHAFVHFTEIDILLVSLWTQAKFTLRVGKRPNFFNDGLNLKIEDIVTVCHVVHVETDVHRDWRSFPKFVHNRARLKSQLLSLMNKPKEIMNKSIKRKIGNKNQLMARLNECAKTRSNWAIQSTWSTMKLTRKGIPTAKTTPMMAPTMPKIPQKTGPRLMFLTDVLSNDVQTVRRAESHWQTTTCMSLYTFEL